MSDHVELTESLDITQLRGHHTVVWTSHNCVDITQLCGHHTTAWTSHSCVDITQQCGHHTIVWTSHNYLDIAQLFGHHTVSGSNTIWKHVILDEVSSDKTNQIITFFIFHSLRFSLVILPASFSRHCH